MIPSGGLPNIIPREIPYSQVKIDNRGSQSNNSTDSNLPLKKPATFRKTQATKKSTNIRYKKLLSTPKAVPNETIPMKFNTILFIRNFIAIL